MPSTLSQLSFLNRSLERSLSISGNMFFPGGGNLSRSTRRPESGFDGIGAIAIIAFQGHNGQPHILANGAR